MLLLVINLLEVKHLYLRIYGKGCLSIAQIVKNQKQGECLSVGECVNKFWCVQMKDYEALEKVVVINGSSKSRLGRFRRDCIIENSKCQK